MANLLQYDIRAMLRKFGVVTVMDVEAYNTVLFKEDTTIEKDSKVIATYDKGEWDALATFNTLGASNREITAAKKPVFTLDTLKIANINQEGPTKTITGGQNADTLLKYGKTVTIEMQDALGKYDVLDKMYGVNYSNNHQIAAVTDRFPGEYTLVGTTFVVDQATGAKQPIKIIIPRFLGDGIFNLTQDAEGDATVFDLNGNVLKFEGGTPAAGGITDSIVAATCTTHSGLDGKLYNTGADNEFYFFSTVQGFEAVEKIGYREAGLATTIEKSTSGDSTTYTATYPTGTSE